MKQIFSHRKKRLSVLAHTHSLPLADVCRLCVCFLERRGRGGGGHEPGGLEREVHGPGGAAHEVQNADHQDPRAHC